jgi:hypothetical protein
LDCQGSLVGSLELNIGRQRESCGLIAVNIELRRESGELIGVQYWTKEGVRWAHYRPILNAGGSLVSSLESNIGLRKQSVSSLESNIGL